MSDSPSQRIRDYQDEASFEYTLRGTRFLVNTEEAPILTDFEAMQPVQEGDQLYYRFRNQTGPAPRDLPVGYEMLFCYGENEHTEEQYYAEASAASKRILTNIYQEGYQEPSVVQMLAIPALLSCRDALIQSKSGSGKTNAFLCGLLMHYEQANPNLQYIFVSSTHEVARQIHHVLLGYLPGDARTALCVGRGKVPGQTDKPIMQQIKEAKVAQVVCCTMGKFYDLCDRGVLRLQDLKAICIDEFDAIVQGRSTAEVKSTGEQLEDIISTLDQHVQRVFVSATVSRYSQRAALGMFRPRSVHVGQPFIMTLPESDLTLDGIRQYYMIEDWKNFLHVVCDLLSNVSFGQCIIFVENSNEVAEVHEALLGADFPLCTPYHGDMSSAERESIYNGFRDGNYRIMVATDLASRGLDFQSVELVVNLGLPKSIATYIHRVGRSGRFGRKGTAVSIIEDCQRYMVEEINRVSDKSKMLNMAQHDIVC